MDNKIITKILDLLFLSVISEGGDGNASWLSKHRLIDELIPLIINYNLENKTGWEIIKKNNHLLWGDNQEWVLITNDKLQYDLLPNWDTIKIDC